MVDINAIIKEQRVSLGGFFPLITCRDGLTFRPVDGYDRGSLPQNFNGPWTKLEIGFCYARFDSIFEPVKNMTDPLTLKAPNVPVELINKMIQHHGGLVAG